MLIFCNQILCLSYGSSQTLQNALQIDTVEILHQSSYKPQKQNLKKKKKPTSNQRDLSIAITTPEIRDSRVAMKPEARLFSLKCFSLCEMGYMVLKIKANGNCFRIWKIGEEMDSDLINNRM